MPITGELWIQVTLGGGGEVGRRLQQWEDAKGGLPVLKEASAPAPELLEKCILTVLASKRGIQGRAPRPSTECVPLAGDSVQ